MVKSEREDEPILAVESVSAVFAHDISTPLTTARMNADLLLEHISIINAGLNSADADNLPVQIKLALERAPQLIRSNIESMERALGDYKNYLNSLRIEDEDSSSANQPQVTGLSDKKRLDILLVDDEDIHHDIGDAVLSNNHSVTHEHSGESAIQRCRTERFDVILMDMQMPSLPGPQTTDQLRKIVAASTLIIGLSNMPIEAKKRELMDLGFNGFLDKPLKLGAFNKILESLSKGSSKGDT